MDASKMNRALYLARPDPDGKELIFTANCIYQKESRCQNHQHVKILEQLSITYLKFTNYFKNTGKHNIENIYGLRDFYHMNLEVVNFNFCYFRFYVLTSLGWLFPGIIFILFCSYNK